MPYCVRKLEGRGLIRDGATRKMVEIFDDEWKRIEGLPRNVSVGVSLDTEILFREKPSDCDELLKALNLGLSEKREKAAARRVRIAAKKAGWEAEFQRKHGKGKIEIEDKSPKTQMAAIHARTQKDAKPPKGKSSKSGRGAKVVTAKPPKGK